MKQKPASNINQFCFDHDMGRTTFYKLLNEGKGPDIIKLGRRTIITAESAKRWREKMSMQHNQESKDKCDV